jgi:flagellar hook assembly protein FlgD
VDLQIFTIYGELVKNIAMGKSFLADETLNLEWDGNNGSGKQVASGIYTAIMNVKYASSQKERLVFNFAVYK